MRVRKGWIVAIAFDDHSEDGESSMPFIVFGRIHSSTKKDITVDCWAHKKDTADSDRSQVKCYTIVKKAITNFTRLAEMPNAETNSSTVRPSLRAPCRTDATELEDETQSEVE